MNLAKNNQHESLLSISIVVYHLDVDILKQLLVSLNNALNGVQFENNVVSIKIIDNGNQENTLQSICSHPDIELSGIEIISGIRNIGYGRAHNLAILTSSSKYHLILNPDIVLAPDSLVEGLHYLDSFPEVCAITPASKDENGNVQHLSKKYPSVFDLALRALPVKALRKYFTQRLGQYERRDISDSTKPAPVEIISGCFMLCQTDYLKQVGGFDERYFLYFEDFALSMELNRLGSLHYVPTMRIVHYGGDAAKKGIRHILMFISSGIKFFNQYGWKLR